jgi:hypothetical protein
MSRGRGSYSRAGDPGNNLFFYRQQYAVFLTPPTPKNLTAILPTFPTAADTFTGSLAEVGTQGTESINGLERLIASLAESGTKGTDSINALERFISQLAETGQLGTDAINAAAGDFYSAVIVELGLLGTEELETAVGLPATITLPNAGGFKVPFIPIPQLVTGRLREIGSRGSESIVAKRGLNAAQRARFQKSLKRILMLGVLDDD